MELPGKTRYNAPVAEEDQNRNEKTRIAPMTMGDETGALIRDALEKAEGKIREKLNTKVPGFAIALVNPHTGERIVRTLQVNEKHPIAFAVLGRHDSVDIMLGTDPALSLRHVIVILSLDEDALPIARVLDLRSGTGMYDVTGAAHSSLASNGPIALRIGNSALLVLPWTLAQKTYDPGDIFGHRKWPKPSIWVPIEPPERHITKVTNVSKISAVVTMPAIDRTLDDAEPDAPPPGNRAGRLKFESGDNSFVMEVDVIALRTGVLVGRYPRCDLNSEMTLVPQSVSRVHALIIHLDERVHIFDVGSTNGLTYKDFPVRFLALPDHQPSTFRLTRQASITWWPS